MNQKAERAEQTRLGRRAGLLESLHRSLAQARAGQLVDADEVIGKLLARG